MYIDEYKLTFKQQLDRNRYRENNRAQLFKYGSYVDLFLNSLKKSYRHFGNVELLFVGSKLYDLVECTNKKVKCLVLSKGSRSLKESLRGGFASYYINKLVNDVTRTYRSEEPDINVLKEYSAIMKKTCDLFYKIRPRAVVFFSNTGAFDRHLSIACKKVNIQTHRIQHGWFYGVEDLNQVSDTFWVWGRYFYDKIKNNYVKLSDITHVFGYPHLMNRRIPNNIPSVGEIKYACFIGQPVVPNDVYKYTFDEKLEKIELIAQILSKYKISLVYRPHGTERRYYNNHLKQIAKISNIQITNRREKLKDAFNKYDLFFSVYSTALVEAAMFGKYTIQVLIGKIKPMIVDGIPYVTDVERELQYMLNSSSLRAGLDDYYIENNTTLDQRVDKFLENIL